MHPKNDDTDETGVGATHKLRHATARPVQAVKAGVRAVTAAVRAVRAGLRAVRGGPGGVGR